MLALLIGGPLDGQVIDHYAENTDQICLALTSKISLAECKAEDIKPGDFVPISRATYLRTEFCFGAPGITTTYIFRWSRESLEKTSEIVARLLLRLFNEHLASEYKSQQVRDKQSWSGLI